MKHDPKKLLKYRLRSLNIPTIFPQIVTGIDMKGKSTVKRR